jgi:hypothetical protein
VSASRLNGHLAALKGLRLDAFGELSAREYASRLFLTDWLREQTEGEEAA